MLLYAGLMGPQVMARACSIETNRGWTSPRACVEPKGIRRGVLGNLYFTKRCPVALSRRQVTSHANHYTGISLNVCYP